MLLTFSSRIFRRPLRGEGRGLSGAFEPNRARAAPSDHVAARVSQCDDRVIERRLYVSPSNWNGLSFSTSGPRSSWHVYPRWELESLLPGRRLPSARHRSPAAALATCIGSRALSPDGETATVAKTAVAAYVYQAPYVHVHFSAHVAFDGFFSAQDIPDTRQVCFGQVFDPRVPLYACLI